MISVIMITYNEARNLPHSLAALQGWVSRIFVVDSGSTDGTQDIARAHHAEVVHHDWEGYARQKNWALDHLPLETPWVLTLDADEVVTPELRQRLLEVTNRPVEQVPENGFFINRLTYFLDRPIRHCGYFPSWNLRLLKRGTGRYEDRAVHEHMVIPDPVGYIREPMLHWDRRGLEHFFAKHNRYSTLEAQQLYREILNLDWSGDTANVTAATRRRRWLKRHIYHRIPFPAAWRFVYMYILRLGILDGWAGFEFCRFIATYDALVALKLRWLLRQHRRGSPIPLPALNQPAGALAMPEGALVEEHLDSATTTAAADRALAHPADPTPRPSSTADSTDATATATAVLAAESDPIPQSPPQSDRPTQMRPEGSPWRLSGKIARAAWMLLGKPLFRISFHNWYAFRRLLLRLFGARIGKRVTIRPSVNVEIPWTLHIEDDVTIGDHAILYSLGRIHIGQRTIISQYAHLCAGTHDYTDHRFPLIRAPITIGHDVWIGADAFVGPGVTIGDLTVLGARSSTYKDLPAGKVCVGNPARASKDRELK